MDATVSKSRFKARALEHFRQVEKTRRSLTITDRGKPVLRLVPVENDPLTALQELRGSVRRYVKPLEPVGMQEWDALR